MMVELWRGAFSSDGTWDHWMIPALDAMRRRGHTLRIPGSCRKQAGAWASKQTTKVATLFEGLRDARLATESRRPRLTVYVEEGITVRWPAPFSSAQTTVRLPPDDIALELLGQPLSLLVENDRADASFLRCVLPSTFRQWERRRWVQFRNGGGNSNIMKLVEEDVSPNAEKRLRTWALIDSDRTSSNHIGTGAKKVKNVLEKAHIAHCMLLRRAVENYLPDALLEDWAREPSARKQRQPWLQAFLAVPAEARRYFKLKAKKDGGVGEHNHPADAILLFPDVVADSSHPLQRGPPGDLSELWRQADANSQAVVVADVGTEFHEIFSAIEEML